MSNRFLRLIIVWAMVLATLYVGDALIRSFWLTSSAPRVVAPRGDLAESELNTVQLFEAVSPAVVYIVTEMAQAGTLGFGRARVGTGSGFIWDAAGHVVTNWHVVEGASRVMVRVSDADPVPARLVGAAPDYDLAVLRLVGSRARLQPIAVGSSDDLRVGQAAFAIGNPYGLQRSLTTGVISALNRRLPTEATRELRGVIQTDAAINPGNSGGPLLDSAGRLIGVNTAIFSTSGASAGIGFAVPVDLVNRVVPQIIEQGRVERPGIGIIALPEAQAASLGVGGIVVAQVLPGSNAERAGLQGIGVRRNRLGDIITHVDGQRVESVADLAAILQDVGVGNTVTLTVMRHGERRQVEVEVMDIG
ncbi:MAG: trypsin-like peptidase domain-containing protein [Candidatus Competibacteraceae bacterium]|nr:trypsin-like peptidase domain-containing protein [Candidatus Competibacteraceae bacterium]